MKTKQDTANPGAVSIGNYTQLLLEVYQVVETGECEGGRVNGHALHYLRDNLKRKRDEWGVLSAQSAKYEWGENLVYSGDRALSRKLSTLVFVGRMLEKQTQND